MEDKILSAQKASSQIGNMYAASVFMSLISDLWYKQKILKHNDKIGFIAYGSGSKAKVFEGRLVNGFAEKLKYLNLEKVLENRTAINFETYESLHCKTNKKSVIIPSDEFYLDKINSETDGLVGLRHYNFAE